MSQEQGFFSKAKESILSFGAFKLAPSLLYFLTMDDESRKRLHDTAVQVQERPDTSIILALNHISINDPWLAATTMYQLDHSRTRSWCAPVSYLHMDPTYKEGKTLRYFVGMANRLGIRTFPIVQDYQVGKEYSAELARRSYEAFISEVDAIHAQQPVGLIIFPEGTRSQGVLGSAKKGIEMMQYKLAPACVVPASIEYLEPYKRSGLNLFHRVKLSIGEVGFVESKYDRLKVEEIMRRIAALLPESMRGQWR